MSTELTVERVLELADEAVAEYGADHTVEVCQIYEQADVESTHKTPLCFVGVILQKVVGDERFQGVRDGAVLEPADSLNLDLYGPVANVLSSLQAYQDGQRAVFDEYTNERYLPISEENGDPRPWGEAVEFVKANLETIVNHKTGEVA